MAIKYYVNEKKRQVIGVLSDCEWDAYNKICKIMRDTNFCVAPHKKYMMPAEFRAVVQCDPKDEFNVEEGMRIAKQRILDRYYPCLHKRVGLFREDALILNGKVFETPKELENNT